MKKQVNPNYVCRLWAGEGNSRPIIVLEGDQSPKTTCESHDWTIPGGLPIRQRAVQAGRLTEPTK